MKSITDPFIHEALGEIQNLSQNEGARWDAFVRERALRDENSQLAAARKEGLQEGIEQGLEQGRVVGKEEGLQEGMEKGHQAGLQDGLSTALTRLINSGIPEAQARQILGLL